MSYAVNGGAGDATATLPGMLGRKVGIPHCGPSLRIMPPVANARADGIDGIAAAMIAEAEAMAKMDALEAEAQAAKAKMDALEAEAQAAVAAAIAAAERWRRASARAADAAMDAADATAAKDALSFWA